MDHHPILKLNDISYAYHSMQGETPVLSHLTFELQKGEFTAIVGPSGCGKSTLLSIIAGLLAPEAGTIEIFGQKQGNPSENNCPAVGYMLQQDHLFEWRTIFQNITLGLELRHQMTPEKQHQADQMLKDYGLYSFRDKKPSELSGGMKQRAALIRTLILEPDLLLLDEPFSALDYQTRLSVSADICRIIRDAGATALLITHDLSEAISLADRVIVLSRRPASVRCSIPIQLTLADNTPLAARNAPEFPLYFHQLWKEITDESKNFPLTGHQPSNRL